MFILFFFYVKSAWDNAKLVIPERIGINFLWHLPKPWWRVCVCVWSGGVEIRKFSSRQIFLSYSWTLWKQSPVSLISSFKENKQLNTKTKRSIKLFVEVKILLIIGKTYSINVVIKFLQSKIMQRSSLVPNNCSVIFQLRLFFKSNTFFKLNSLNSLFPR